MHTALLEVCAHAGLLKRLLPLRKLISSMYLLLEVQLQCCPDEHVRRVLLVAMQNLPFVHQEGAARRLVEAQPGDKDYRAINVFIDHYADTRCCLPVGRCARLLKSVKHWKVWTLL